MDNQPSNPTQNAQPSTPAPGAPPPEQKQPSTKEAMKGCGCLVLLMLPVVLILKSCFFGGGLSAKDLKNPPVALEKLARQAFALEKGVESVKVEEAGLDGHSYALAVHYRTDTQLTDKLTYDCIRSSMKEAYAKILQHPELPVFYMEITAQLELHDDFGNKSWGDVYQTMLNADTIKAINRKNLDEVKFEEIWDVVWVHPIFRPFNR